MTKYGRWYLGLMIKARNRGQLKGYCERHHIWPKSCGGSNDKANIVTLTYREHFIAHWLLVKMNQEGPWRNKLLHALANMALKKKGQRVCTARQYEIARKARSDAMKGNIINKGRKLSDECKAKLHTHNKTPENIARLCAIAKSPRNVARMKIMSNNPESIARITSPENRAKIKANTNYPEHLKKLHAHCKTSKHLERLRLNRIKIIAKQRGIARTPKERENIRIGTLAAIARKKENELC